MVKKMGSENRLGNLSRTKANFPYCFSARRYHGKGKGIKLL